MNRPQLIQEKLKRETLRISNQIFLPDRTLVLAQHRIKALQKLAEDLGENPAERSKLFSKSLDILAEHTSQNRRP